MTFIGYLRGAMLGAVLTGLVLGLVILVLLLAGLSVHGGVDLELDMSVSDGLWSLLILPLILAR